MRWSPRHGILLLAFVSAGCSGEPGPSPLPDSIRWEEIDGATAYRVRAFAGDHLLFEESTSETELRLDASMRRACAVFDTVDVVVRARGVQAPPRRLRIRP